MLLPVGTLDLPGARQRRGPQERRARAMGDVWEDAAALRELASQSGGASISEIQPVCEIEPASPTFAYVPLAETQQKAVELDDMVYVHAAPFEPVGNNSQPPAVTRDAGDAATSQAAVSDGRYRTSRLRCAARHCPSAMLLPGATQSLLFLAAV